MKTQGVSRRRFLALCGGGIAGIWLAGTGFVALPNEMVFAMSGSCSFCGKEAKEIFGLVGIAGRNARICNECIELCFDIIADEVDPHALPDEIAPMVETSSTISQELFDYLRDRIASGERGDPLIDAMVTLLGTTEEILKNPPKSVPPVTNLICSFCGKDHNNVAKLIAGPTVYICDGCVGDAGALFMRYGWRPASGNST
jgi:ClpX C4-type zinc finger